MPTALAPLVLSLLASQPGPVGAPAAAPEVAFTLPASSAAEASGSVAVEVRLDALHTLDVQVPYTLGGTAVAGVDFSVPPGPLVIPAGQLSGDIVVTLLDDPSFEPDETVVIDLGLPSNATLGAPASHTLSIVNDDGPLGGQARGDLPRPLQVSTSALALPATRVGDQSAQVPLSVTNVSGKTVRLEAFQLAGAGAAGFAVQPSVPLPATLAAGQGLQLLVSFAPGTPGPHAAELMLAQVPHAHLRPRVALSATAFGPPGAEVLVNTGGPAVPTSSGETFLADYGFTIPGTVVSSPTGNVQGTSDPELYKDLRTAPVLHFEYELPDGAYLVTLRFAELSYSAAGKRVFDVDVEGKNVRKNLDVAALVGKQTAHKVSTLALVSDGRLDVDLSASVDMAMLSALEVRSLGELSAAPASVDLGVLDVGQVASADVTLENVGHNGLLANSLSIQTVAGDGSDFSVELNGVFYQGNPFTASHSISLPLQPGETQPMRIWFSPSGHDFHDLRVQLRGDFPTLELPVAGGAGIGGDPYLHPVLSIADIVVDYDLSGSEPVLLDGSGSHTHEPGHALTAWEWREGGALVASGEKVTTPFALGPHTVELTILDDNQPPRSLADTADFEVHPVDAVPGVLVTYYVPGSGQTPADLLDAVPANPDFAEVRAGLEVLDDDGVGGSGLAGNVMVRARATLSLASGGTFVFLQGGGHDQRLEIDGVQVSGPVSLAAGAHAIEARWAVASTLELPLDVLADLGGGAPAAIDPALLTHDQRATPPVINDMPGEGINLGGNQIVIDGFGFFPQSLVTVHWGNVDLTQADFTSWSAERIEFLSPPGSGFIDVTVETPQGTSNVRSFEYKPNGPVPIVFNTGPAVGVTQATAAAWGPDGRLYVTSFQGSLHAITYGDDYAVQSVASYPGVSALANNHTLGLAFDPFDPPGVVRLYVAHTLTYAQGGGAFSGPSPYPGQISRLDGPAFDTPVPVVTGLPTSNHDHAANGMVFDDNGDLLVCLGSNTNAGVPHPNIGDLPESPLTAAILKVELSRPDFNGVVTYLDTATGQVEMDQVNGHKVDVADGVHVSVHASGIRNPYDLELTTWGELYCTDNGPNTSFGQASTGASTQTPWHASDVDELLRVEYGRYYGSPNRNRGRYVAIENVYYGTSAPEVPGFTQQISTLSSSSNGLVEYRASTFNDALRGNLLAQKYNAGVTRIELTPDHLGVSAASTMSILPAGLALETGPGGAILGIGFLNNVVTTFLPQDAGAVGLTVYDILPWRAPAHGGGAFVIGGSGFGTLADTSVTIGGLPATLTSVSPTRIRGLVPDNGGPSAGLLDVVVTVGASSKPLPGAFRFLPPTRGAAKGQWSSLPSMSVPLGEVACGVLGGRLLVVGETSVKTLAYDFATQSWDDTPAVRPFVGHHHAAEVHGGKWYLVGGLGAGMGKVQVYDPQSNTWSLGADMPWPGGSVSTCLIGGKIYAAGGIVGSTTVDQCAVYDIATNAWTALAPMPAGKGRNHAAAGTDGQRLWIFGGRGIGSGAGNVVANGFADVQVYDPQSDSWSASFDPGSNLVPMPIGRGGTGRAVFHKGLFWIFGGETLNGPGATVGNVYDRVDVYDPASDTWRLEAPMPTPRHGIFPVVWQGKIHVPGGGVTAGFSNSDAFEVFYKP